MNNKQPALLLSYTGEQVSTITPVLVPCDWDGAPEDLPFSVGSNQVVVTEQVNINTTTLVTY